MQSALSSAKQKICAEIIVIVTEYVFLKSMVFDNNLMRVIALHSNASI